MNPGVVGNRHGEELGVGGGSDGGGGGGGGDNPPLKVKFCFKVGVGGAGV